MSVLASPTVAPHGESIVPGPNPPDRAIPSKCPPPGVTTPGCWVVFYFHSGPTAGGKAIAGAWAWAPLPVGQMLGVSVGNGIIMPTAVMGSIASMQRSPANGQALQNGPWLYIETGTDPQSLQKRAAKVLMPGPVNAQPSAVPAGFSGGTWTKAGPDGLWCYDNGQAAGSSVLPYVLGAAAVSAATAAAYFL